MGQTVTMEIDYHGGSEKHLKLRENPTVKKSGGPVLWKVKVNELHGRVVTLWFPDDNQIFNGPHEVRFELDADGQAERLLTINQAFQIPNNDFVVPFAVYCDIEEVDQDPNPDRGSKKFKQRGRQMVDGPNSHPECKVGGGG